MVIESCKIVRGVVRSTLSGAAELKHDPYINRRKEELISETNYLLNFIKEEYSAVSEDPLCDAFVLTDCIKRGILDAPHIVKKGEFKGTLQTRVRDGKCLAWDTERQCAMNEEKRLNKLTEMVKGIAV